ncbi:MAG: hypothetical protein H6823_25810 [Planctomycetaceae bacterium]|nr:hypothetical protein [Planctomycetales bacterium]MCB9941668.1 hypothetical protein [Planctomycetaceae bacterium]
MFYARLYRSLMTLMLPVRRPSEAAARQSTASEGRRTCFAKVPLPTASDMTITGAIMVTFFVAGCAGPGWFAHGEYGLPRQHRAVEKDAESPTALTEARGNAAPTPSNPEPSLSQVLDDLERIKQQNPSDFKVIQSAIEDESTKFPPAFQQLYKDQMMGLALSQLAHTQPAITEQPTLPAAQPHHLPDMREPVVQPMPLSPPLAFPTSSTVTPAAVAPANYSIDAAASSVSATAHSIPVTTTVSDMPMQLPAQVAATELQPVAVATTSTGSSAVTEASPEVVIEPGQWSREIEQALTSLSADLARPNLDRDERARLEIMRRLLYVVTNQRDEAVSSIEQLDEDEREYWKHQIHGLLVSIDADGKHPTTRRAALALRNLRTATDHLANVSTLDVRNLTFCQEVLSYGEYRVFDSYSFRAKDEVVMYVEIDNFAAHPRGDSFETELHSSYEIVDGAGKRVANVVLPVDKQVSNNRRRDYFIAYLITMPSQIASGSYRLQLTVEDVIGKKSNHAAIDFRIQ